MRWTLLALITLAGAAFRFYGLDWGIPYHHFHADEYLALRGSDMLRHAPRVAAESVSFFVYPVLPKELHIVLVALYEWARHPLDLNAWADQVAFIRLGRIVSATLGAATIPAVWLAGRRLGGTAAAALAAALAAASVQHIRSSHFFTADAPLVFFCALALPALMAIADRGRLRAYVAAGLAIGAALACKYTAAFLLVPLAVAHVAAPDRPHLSSGRREQVRWIARLLCAVGLAAAVFVLTNPLILMYPAKFVRDIADGIIATNFSESGPIWTQQFADVPSLRVYWFSNLLPWGLGPAFAAAGIAGVAWALARGGRAGWIVGAYAGAYYAIAGQTTTPYIRYILPLVPALAAGAGGLGAALLASRGRARRAAAGGVAAVVGLTWLWALAFMHVYARPDARIQAARYIRQHIPQHANILVEPSQNTPPMGRYLTQPEFYTDYVRWGPRTTHTGYYTLHTLDVYRTLHDGRMPAQAKRQYIEERLALADYIVMDDTFLEFYEHLDDPGHAPVRQYYDDLFAGRLGFRLLRSFQVRPSLFGWHIDDEAAEMTFTLFDHPEVYVFERNER